MKKTLVIKPPHSFVPIGIGYVLASLVRDGVPFDFYDMLRPEHPESYYFDRIAAGEYLAVATGGFVYSMNIFRDLMVRAKKLSPNTPFILGGNVTRNVKPEILFNHLPLDYTIVGEAENSFPLLLKALDAGSDNLSAIPNIVYRRPVTNRLVRNPIERVKLDGDFFMPAYEFIDMQFYVENYRHHIVPGLGRMMPVLTGRGCTGGCSFCSPTVGRFSPRKLEHILEEVRILNERYDFESFGFATEVFFEADEDVIAFCEAYKNISPLKPWCCCFRPDQSPELLPIMQDAGCEMVCVGLESASEIILPTLKKGCTIEGFKQVYDAAQAISMRVDSPFMITNENETEEDLKKTFDFIIEHEIDANFGLVGTYPGTAIYSRALRDGLIANEWEYITEKMVAVPWRSPQAPEMPYLNISAIPQQSLFPVIYSEIRRYYTFMYNSFSAKNNRLDADPVHPNHLVLHGECRCCGKPLSAGIGPADNVAAIENIVICHKCHAKNFLHFYDLPPLLAYHEEMQRQLHDAGKLLILGTDRNAQAFFFYDIFKGVDLDRIVGVVDPRPDATERQFYHVPRYRTADLDRVDFDTLLIFDLDRSTAERIIRSSTALANKPRLWIVPALEVERTTVQA